jgi:alkylresorcinol/alkylpyrone synthase
MELYRKNATQLAVQAAQRCLADAGIEPRAIDLIATSSCTGVMLPSLAAVIADRLGLRDDARRLPLTEVGCAGGASVLARAYDFLRAYPKTNALVVAVELPSLTLQHDDDSSDNLVASALFGDGAAAVLVQGSAETGLEVLGTHTEVLPGSLGDLGFDLRDGGFHVVLSKRVPEIIAQHARRVVTEFLSEHGLSERALTFYVLHPGGPRILGALEDALHVSPGGAAVSREVLRNYGNQSSASVLFVLRETMARGVRDGVGLLAAFGPGITVELSLLRAQS